VTIASLFRPVESGGSGHDVTRQTAWNEIGFLQFLLERVAGELQIE